jgi:hypothetical protein
MSHEKEAAYLLQAFLVGRPKLGKDVGQYHLSESQI